MTEEQLCQLETRFDNEKYKSIDGDELSSLIAGLTVCGAEPIDYPNTDGAIFYFMDDSKYVSIDIGTDSLSDVEFYIQYAEIPR